MLRSMYPELYCVAVQLVNVQSNSEFASHMLNRDVWRDDTVKNIIKVGFVLYQVLVLSCWCPTCLLPQDVSWHLTPA